VIRKTEPVSRRSALHDTASTKRLSDKIISIFLHNRTLERAYRPSSCLSLFLASPAGFARGARLRQATSIAAARVAPRQTSRN